MQEDSIWLSAKTSFYKTNSLTSSQINKSDYRIALIVNVFGTRTLQKQMQLTCDHYIRTLCVHWTKLYLMSCTSECHLCCGEGNDKKKSKTNPQAFSFFLLCIIRMHRIALPVFLLNNPPSSSVMHTITWHHVSAKSAALSPSACDAVRLMFWMCERHRVWIRQNHRLASALSRASLIGNNYNSMHVT